MRSTWQLQEKKKWQFLFSSKNIQATQTSSAPPLLHILQVKKEMVFNRHAEVFDIAIENHL